MNKNKNAWTKEAFQKVIAEKEAGATYKALGERYGVTRERMRQVHMQALRKRRNGLV